MRLTCRNVLLAAGLAAAVPAGARAADFNADGRADILWRHQTSGQNQIWYMNGATQLGTANLTTLSGASWQIAGAADMNADGKPDIVWRNQGDGQNYVWYMNGATQAGGAPLPTLADAAWRIVGVADFNADTKPDLLWRNAVSGQNYLWYLNGVTQTGGSSVEAQADTNWLIVGVGDFNFDAKPDIVWRNQSTGANRLWYMDGATKLSEAALPVLADANWQIVGVADFDGDGKADLLWRHQTTGQNYLWFMNNTVQIGTAPVASLDLNWRVGGSATYNQPPVSRPGGPYWGVVNTPIAFSGATSSDADGTIASYAWTFGDGGTSSGSAAAVSHAYTATGTYDVGLTVTDNGGATNTAATKATVCNPTIVQSVVWGNAVNATAAGSTLTKSSSATALWNGGASSTKALCGDAYVEFTASGMGARMVGLSVGDSAQAAQDIDFAVSLGVTGALHVSEAGVLSSSLGSYAAGDVFRIEVVTSGSPRVRYLKNGTQFRETSVTPASPLLVDASILTPGAAIANVQISGAYVDSPAFDWTAAAAKIYWRSSTSNTFKAWFLSGTTKTGEAPLHVDVASSRTAMGVGDFDSDGRGDIVTQTLSAGQVGIVHMDGVMGIGDIAVTPTVAPALRAVGSADFNDDLKTDILWRDSGNGQNVAWFMSDTTRLGTGVVNPLPDVAWKVVGAGDFNGDGKDDMAWRHIGNGQNYVWYMNGVQMIGGGSMTTVADANWRIVGTGDFNDDEKVDLLWWNAATGVVHVWLMNGLAQVSTAVVGTLADTTWVPVGYAPEARVDRPRLSPAPGTHPGAINVTVRCHTAGAKIHYTTAGEPTESDPSVLCGDTIPVRESVTLKLKGFRAGLLPGRTVSAPYTITQPLVAPVIHPGSGTYTRTLRVELSSSTPNTTIRYTTDNSLPQPSSPLYVGPIDVTVGLTLRAVAFTSSGVASAPATATYELKAADPVLGPGGGTFHRPQNPVVGCPSDATVRYTTNPNDPTETAPTVACGVGLPVNVTTTLKLRAFRSGWTSSGVVAETYVLKVGKATSSLRVGAHAGAQTAVLSSESSGATLHYTFNGADPTTASPSVPVDGSVPINASGTLRVKGFKTGWTAGDVASFTYVIVTPGPAVDTPVISPAAATYTSSQTVSMTTGTPGAFIRYTVDGSVPGPASPRYTGPFTIDTDTVVKASAFKPGLNPSGTATSSYTINLGRVATPTFSVTPGTYPTRQTVVINCATSGVVTIRYTTNGVDPTTTDTPLTPGGSITIDRSTVLKAKAWKSGVEASSIRRGDYRIAGAIAAGGDHTLVLKSDGTVWSWGRNDSGQLGNNSNVSSNTPVAVTGIATGRAVAAGLYHSLTLHSNGIIVAWGQNSHGQLGTGNTTPRTVPGTVSGVTGAVAIAAGHYHSLALKSDGTVVAWGRNDSGQLGDNTTTPRLTAVTVNGLTSVVAISTGEDHSLALKSDGTVWAWGANAAGQLGDNTTTPALVPRQVPGLNGIGAIVAGAQLSMALKSDGGPSGVLWAWGSNESGRLGDGTTTNRLAPVSVLPSASAMAASSHAIAVQGSGLLRAWGKNDAGQVGDGSFVADRLSPVAVAGATRVAAVAVGVEHSVALRHDGTVLAWGANAHGQLGDGTNEARRTPVVVPGFAAVNNIAMNADPDNDGLSTGEELALGADPLNADTNGDGVVDGVAAASGLSVTNPDMDGDGLANSIERARSTDPFKADTDGDGVADGTDAFPLDATQSQATPTPGDTTPPVITLLEPTNAIPVP